ncbi:MAG: dTDP-4-dehydrorhamnose reductase [Gemmatimonadetes bacterium 13_1_40CM_4_69_8]|nr:MAG: dTDP-4-dehydrorhamnose reductase [Gemmatimonadetes bacterium 13_1_40CM_4_69_8]
MSSSRLVAILGATGQLGSDLVRAAAAAGVEHAALSHEEVEVTDAASLARAFERLKPAIVINSAAFHQVDHCEEDPSEAYRVNAVGALLAARAAKAVGARYLYVSTDYVFDGNRQPGTAYVEDDQVAPLNVYGASKAAGEQLVAQALEKHLVVRVSSLFGVAGARGKGGNFIETILKKAREGGPLKVVNDQWMTPTYTADASAAILRLALGDARGVVHVTNPEQCTWHAFASEAVSLTGLGVPVEATSVAAFPSKVRRPRNSALRTGRLASLLGAPLRPWREALRAYLAAKGYLN